MKKKAIEKLARECEQNASKPTYMSLVCIEEYFTEKMTEKIAEKILQEGKSLPQAYEKIRQYASQNRNGAREVCVPPNRAMEIIEEYYGIVPADYEETPKAEPKTSGFDILDLM